jgi:hypothetical protein
VLATLAEKFAGRVRHFLTLIEMLETNCARYFVQREMKWQVNFTFEAAFLREEAHRTE